MTNRITVVPAAGRSVPDPEAGDLLPIEGREVPDNTWWRRLLKAGDITLKAKPTKGVTAPKNEEAQ